MHLHAVRIRWLVPGLLLCACYGSTGEPSVHPTQDPDEGSASNGVAGSSPAARGLQASSSAPVTAIEEPPVPWPPAMPQPTSPTPVTTPAPAPEKPRSGALECPSVFAEPPPADPQRMDAGARGLTALRAELQDSLARWQETSAAHGGRYSYTQSASSFFGSFCRTTVHVDGGEVSSRTQLRGAGDAIETELWTELAGELSTHAGACHMPFTMEELYRECSSVLCKDPRENYLFFELDADGLLRVCGFVPMSCADDCFEGVELTALRLGDDARDCCPIEESPSCCMEYGGADLEGSGCYTTCDGMPAPNAPWTRAFDEHGCPKWIEPPATDQCCGCP